MSWPRRQTNRPWIYGHRGVRDSAAENTLAAFETALAEGADGIEFDVRLNFEGAVVVFHDESLARMTGGLDSRNVFDVPWRELKQICLLNGGAIPSLNDVLIWASGRGAYLNIELKQCSGFDERLAAGVVREIEARASDELKLRILLSSFSAQVRIWVDGHPPGLPFARLIDPERGELLTDVPDLEYGVHPHFTEADAYRTLLARDSHPFVNVWTVNETAIARHLDAMGVDGLITDRPRLIRGLFE